MSIIKIILMPWLPLKFSTPYSTEIWPGVRLDNPNSKFSGLKEGWETKEAGLRVGWVPGSLSYCCCQGFWHLNHSMGRFPAIECNSNFLYRVPFLCQSEDKPKARRLLGLLARECTKVWDGSDSESRGKCDVSLNSTITDTNDVVSEYYMQRQPGCV